MIELFEAFIFQEQVIEGEYDEENIDEYSKYVDADHDDILSFENVYIVMIDSNIFFKPFYYYL